MKNPKKNKNYFKEFVFCQKIFKKIDVSYEMELILIAISLLITSQNNKELR